MQTMDEFPADAEMPVDRACRRPVMRCPRADEFAPEAPGHDARVRVPRRSVLFAPNRCRTRQKYERDEIGKNDPEEAIGSSWVKRIRRNNRALDVLESVANCGGKCCRTRG